MEKSFGHIRFVIFKKKKKFYFNEIIINFNLRKINISQCGLGQTNIKIFKFNNSLYEPNKDFAI